MADTPRITPTKLNDNNIPSNEEMTAHAAEHEAYQTALLRHMTLHRAWMSERFDDDMKELFERAQAILPPGKAQSPEHVTATMLEQAFIAPEKRFPDIADAIKQEVKNQDITHLLELLDHDRNANLSALSTESKEKLLAIAGDPYVRHSLQFDMAHERDFGTSSTVEGGSLRTRIEAWIEQGMSNDLAKCMRRGIQTSLLLGGGLAASAGIGAALAIPKVAQFFREWAQKGFKAASQYAGERMSLSADRILAIPERIGQWFDKGRLKTNAKTAFSFISVAGAVSFLGYAVNSPDNPPGVGLMILDSLGSLRDLDFSIWDQANAAVSEVKSADSPSALIDDARNAQKALAGFILSGLAATYPSRFDFTLAGSFFKDNPTHLGTPTVDTGAIDHIGSEGSLENTISEPSDYTQCMSLLEATLQRIEAHPQQAEEILTEVSPLLPDVFERIAVAHQALIENSGITQLSRKSQHSARLLNEMTSPKDAEKVFMVAAGQRCRDDGQWYADDRLGAGRHRGKVVNLLSEIAKLTQENVPADLLAPDTSSRNQAPQRETMVTPVARSGNSTPAI